jgi:hypothetical protein
MQLEIFIKETGKNKIKPKQRRHWETFFFKLILEPKVVSHPDGELEKTEINHLFILQLEDLKIFREDVQKLHSN